MYFIALAAPPHINEQVLKWKNWMKEQFGCVVALRSPAHITLVPPFWMDPILENELNGDLSAFASARESVLIYLKDFAHFDTKVIYVDVVPNAQLPSLKNELQHFLLIAEKYPLKKDDHEFRPHLTIATRDLYKKAYYEAWKFFSTKKYEAEWLAREIAVLKHNSSSWEVFSVSPFR